MQNIFKMTRERLDLYTKRDKHDLDLYNDVSGDIKTAWKKLNATPDKIKTIWQAAQKIKGDK